MSLISSFKRALGFPDDFDGDEDGLEDDSTGQDDFIDDPDPAPDEIVSTENGNANPPTENQDKRPISDEEFNEISAEIFDAVLKYFNSHQPELIQRCLDIDAQRTMVIQNIDHSLRTRLEALADRACRNGEGRLAEKHRKMGEELLKLKSDYNSVRQQREEIQSAQLSATRQKRALTERISDLESQVMTLEAEREQFQLENSSMAARLRAMGGGGNATVTPLIHGYPDSKLTEENRKLKNELEAAKTTIESNNHEIERLKAEVETLKTESNKTSLTSDEMEEYREIRKQMGALRQAKELSESHIVKLNNEIKECNATINRLQKQLADSAIKAEEYKSEIESLNSTIEANLYAHAAEEAELRKQLSDLKDMSASSRFTTPTLPSMPEVTDVVTIPEGKRNKKSRKRKSNSATRDNSEQQHVKISAIDELMDNTDWFVAPDPVPLKKDPEVEENFGYKEPAKKPDSPEDDRQLTLW